MESLTCEACAPFRHVGEEGKTSHREEKQRKRKITMEKMSLL